MRFKDGRDKDTTSNQLTIMTVDNSTVNEEYEVPTIDVMSDYSIYLDKG